MNAKTILSTAILAVALTIPSATAGWVGSGAYEPNTLFDKDLGRMYLDAPQTPFTSDPTPARVYFNVYQGTYVTAVNPNVGTLETRIYNAPNVNYQALLGVWRDCNHDGYIGLAEGAVMEYRAELLDDEGRAICPAYSWTFNSLPFSVAGPLVHNDAQWVTEFIWIGAVDPCQYEGETFRAENCAVASFATERFRKDPTVLYVNNTFIWGDNRLPGPIPPSTGSSGCPLSPTPKGTTSGTGYALLYADCSAAGRGVSVTANWNGVVDAVDPSNSLSLRFENPREPQSSSSHLNQHFPVTLYGNPQSDKPGSTGLLERRTGDKQFNVFDCDKQGVGFTADPSSRSLNPWVKNPTDDLTNPAGSVWDSVHEIEEELLYDCTPFTGQNQFDQFHFLAHLPERTTPDTVEPVTNRKESSYRFSFQDGETGTGSPAVDRMGFYRVHGDGGVTYNRRLGPPDSPLWDGHTNFATTPQLLRTSDQQPTPRGFDTFYARIGSLSGLDLPNPTPGKYGAEACPSIGPGVPDTNGWVCDPTKWYRTSSGLDTMPYSDRCAHEFEEEKADAPNRRERCAAWGGVAYGQLVGADYHMLDIDCYDGRVADDVHASLIWVGGLETCDDE